MQKFSAVIVGGGASGMVGAISAAGKGVSCVICERLSRPGKKVLSSGNGRCNLSNDRLDSSFYNPASKPLADSVFSKFGGQAIISFFHELGLKTYSEEGRIFPATNQSASVLKVLEIELKRLSIPVELDFDVVGVSDSGNAFTVTSRSGEKVRGDRLILACGGKSYPALGSNGSGYFLARHFGHNIIEPVPSAVPVVAKDALCHILQGQKISSKVTAVINAKPVREASGDLLFTKYGLSGRAVLDISEELSIALNRRGEKDVVIAADMVPFMRTFELADELGKRISEGMQAEELIAGILPNKFGIAFKELLKRKDAGAIAMSLKYRPFRVLGTRGWNEAEFTSGGVDTKEVDISSLESKLKKGLYFAGEILDVNGRRGGYNLAWAWASGHVAGESVSH